MNTENENAGATGNVDHAGTKGDPTDAGIAGSAGNVGNVGTGNAGDSGDGGGASGGAAQAGNLDQAGSAAPQAQSGADSLAARTGILIPPVDVIEDASGITLLADLPGVSKDKLDLRLETNSLTISGEVSLDVAQDMESRYAEVKHQHYQRTFALSKELDGEQASAELTHGVLKIRIPKTAHAQPRKVQIKVA